jgi:hypothetical protein
MSEENKAHARRSWEIVNQHNPDLIEVRHPQATPSNRKDTPYGGCALYLGLDTVIALANRQD